MSALPLFARHTTCSLPIITLLLASGGARAQNSTRPLQSTLTPRNGAAAATIPSALEIESQIERGEELLDNGDDGALPVLGAVSQSALTALAAKGGNALLTASPERIPELGEGGEMARRAARAHLAWGRAADKFARRDLAITALCRAYRLAGPNRLGTNRLSREALFALGSLGREGLPDVAPDDTIDTLSSLALWKPRRFRFEWNGAALHSPSPLPVSGRNQSQDNSIDLMVTQGTLFPPSPDSTSTNDDKAVVAPLYRRVFAERLPPVLKLGYMVAGFVRQNNGPNRGMWKQVVRVFYPHPVLTRNNRNDRPRAEALAAQFLKVHTLLAGATGLSNRYAGDGVTTLWLSEVSALWPLDDDDPDVQQEMGIRMPNPNVPLSAEERARRRPEVEWSPLVKPWLAAAQIDSAPGDILFFKVGQNRPETEWLREIVHEYGHVALPPLGGFRAPLEPFANGLIGETVAMTWISAAAGAFEVALPSATNSNPMVRTSALQSTSVAGGASTTSSATTNSTSTGSTLVRRSALTHVARNAIPALRLWNAQGPASPLRRDGARWGLQYLQGLNVYIERVYGAPLWGATCRPLIERSAYSFNRRSAITPTNAEALLNSLAAAMRDPFPSRSRVLPIWLPGALQALPSGLSATALTNRAPLALRPNERTAALLFVPSTAKKLRIEWKGGRDLRAEGFQSTLMRPRMAGAGAATEIDVAGRAGWNRFSFVASNGGVVVGTAFLK